MADAQETGNTMLGFSREKGGALSKERGSKVAGRVSEKGQRSCEDVAWGGPLSPRTPKGMLEAQQPFPRVQGDIYAGSGELSDLPVFECRNLEIQWLENKPE